MFYIKNKVAYVITKCSYCLLQDSCDMSVKVLECLLKMVVLIGAVILVFGMGYSYLALDVYGGQILSAGSGKT